MTEIYNAIILIGVPILILIGILCGFIFTLYAILYVINHRFEIFGYQRKPTMSHKCTIKPPLVVIKDGYDSNPGPKILENLKYIRNIDIYKINQLMFMIDIMHEKARDSTDSSNVNALWKHLQTARKAKYMYEKILAHNQATVS